MTEFSAYLRKTSQIKFAMAYHLTSTNHPPQAVPAPPHHLAIEG